MTLFQQRYARGSGIREIPPGQTMFQISATGNANMDQIPGTKRSIREMRRIILLSMNQLDVNNTKEEAPTQPEILSKFTQQLEHISK